MVPLPMNDETGGSAVKLETKYPETEAEWLDVRQVTTHIPLWHAERLLEIASLEKDSLGRYGGKYWELEEALRHALLLIAETDTLAAA